MTIGICLKTLTTKKKSTMFFFFFSFIFHTLFFRISLAIHILKEAGKCILAKHIASSYQIRKKGTMTILVTLN